MGRIALIVLLMLPFNLMAQDLTPLHTGLVAKPAWEVCGNFACYTKDEQLKVLRMRSHYEAVFTYALVLEKEVEILTRTKQMYEEQHQLQKDQLVVSRVLLTQQREEAKKEMELVKKDHTTDLIVYTGAGALVGAALAYLLLTSLSP